MNSMEVTWLNNLRIMDCTSYKDDCQEACNYPSEEREIDEQ